MYAIARLAVLSIMTVCACGPCLLAADAALGLKVLAPEVQQYELVEFAVEIPGGYDNPLDPQQVDLTLVIRTPGGQTLRLPAFSMQPYEYQTDQKSGREVAWVYPVGRPVWRGRFAAAETGRYEAVAELREAGRLTKSSSVHFRSTISDSPGFVRVSQRDPRFFEFDNGRPYFAIGQNLAFIGDSQFVTLPKMEVVFDKLSSNGANWVRIWTCCHDWALAIEARKSAWGRSWDWRPPIVTSPDSSHPGDKCLQLVSDDRSTLTVSPSHAVALRPRTSYVLSGRIKTEPSARVQVVSGRHELVPAVTSGPGGAWQTFSLEFETGGDERWLERTTLRLEGRGTAWLDDLSLTESGGGPELLWEADVDRDVRGFYNPIDCFMLDRVVAEAGRQGIYLQLCLLTRDVYMESLTNDESPEYRQAIEDAKNLLRYAVARWGYSTAVVSWEYFNEQDPRLPTDRFYRELGEYLRQVDPYKHLRSTSTWHPSPGDWQHPQLDVADTHFYLRPGPERKYADEAAAAVGNARELRRHAPRKPALIGEFGLANQQWQPTEAMKESSEVIDFHNGLWASALSGVSGTAMFWWWDRLDRRDHYVHYRPLADFVADIPWTTAGLQSASVKVLDRRVRCHGLASGDQAYLWLFDPRASFESVVVEGVEPVELTGVRVELPGMAAGDYQIQWWNTYTGEVVSDERLAVSAQPLILSAPPFTCDLAVKIRPAPR